MRSMVVGTVALGVWLTLQADLTPARLVSGGTPPLPRDVLGGGQVLLEATVGRDGRVVGLVPLRVTPPLTTYCSRPFASGASTPP